MTKEIVEYLANRAVAQVVSRTLGQKPLKDPELAKLVAKYNHPTFGLKAHFLSETHGKCAYCESKVTHVDYGDIEHIIPKAVRPDLAVDITNLTVACGVCNTNKSDYYNEHARLVDPHEDDCRHEIAFFGWGIAQAMCGAKGRHTLRELELNREALSKRRENHFNKLGELVSSWRKEVDPAMAYALLLTIWDHVEPSEEYSSMCLTALEHFDVDRRI